jgi:hypothetical protein
VSTPKYAEWRTTTVRELWKYNPHVPYWIVRVHKHSKYHFETTRGDGGTETPGWLGQCEFTSYEDAAEFAAELDTLIAPLHDLALQMSDARNAVYTRIARQDPGTKS